MQFQQKQNNRPINQISNNKFCNNDADCGLLLCSGCFSKEFLKTAPPDLPCINYEGYHCECNENKCAEIKNERPLSSEITREKLNSLNETQCKQSGYKWAHIPGLCLQNKEGEYDCGSRCDIPTKDAGNKCYSNNECEGACLCSKNEKDSEGFQIGECSSYKYFTEVSDCPCILKTKSKTPDFPYGCQ